MQSVLLEQNEQRLSTSPLAPVHQVLGDSQSSNCRQSFLVACKHTSRMPTTCQALCLLPLHVLRSSVVPDSATPWTTAHQAPPFMGFSRQEHWSGLPFPSPSYLLTKSKNRVSGSWQGSSYKAKYHKDGNVGDVKPEQASTVRAQHQPQSFHLSLLPWPRLSSQIVTALK